MTDTPELSEDELKDMLARVQQAQPQTKLLAVYAGFDEIARIGKPPRFPNADGSKIGSVVTGINIIAQNPNGNNGEVMPTYQIQVFVKGQVDPRIFLVPQMICVPEMQLQRIVVPAPDVPSAAELVAAK